MAKARKGRWTDNLGLLFTPPPPPSAGGDQYYYITQRPWPSLIFILPMLLFFEIGTAVRQGGVPGASSQLVATYLIDALASGFGRSAFYIPGMLAIVILLATHLAARHPWRTDFFVFAGMTGESLIYTIPLFVFDKVLHTALRATTSPTRSEWIDQVIRSFGAGIYEELVFRLMLITGLAILLVNICKLPRSASSVCIILISAGLFAAQHHPPLGAEPFEMARFVFRTAAGLYLAGLFVFRGFGIACGCHAFYNVILVTIKAV